MAIAEEPPEFSRMIALKQVDDRIHRLEASEQECAALAKRFGLVAVKSLVAEIALERDDQNVSATGTMQAEIVQSCAVTGDDLPVSVDEQLVLRFVPEDALAAASPDEEIELDADELDAIPYADEKFDLGEAVAQSLALAIDPYAVGPDAEEARKSSGLMDESDAGPFAALKALKGD